MKHRVFWARFFLVATIATAALIFWFSAQQGDDSQQMSDGITLQMAQVLRPDFEEMTKAAQQSYLKKLSLIVRKNAHFCEYMLLGFNLLGWLRFSRPDKRWRACQIPAWALATLYAITDEAHQMFISERSARVLDIAIDSLGGLTGVLCATLALYLLLQKAGSRR